jgi:hypothetical protein
MWSLAGGVDWDEVLEHSHQFEHSGEFADLGVPRASNATGQTIVFAARYVHDEFHWRCRPLPLGEHGEHRTKAAISP